MLDDAVATQDTVTQLIAAIRRVIRVVPGAGEVAAVCCSAHDYTRAGKPVIAWDDEQARAELVDALVGDALRLLGHLPEQELGPAAADAVGLLALVAGQDVEPAEGGDGSNGRWRIARTTVPDRMVSTVDPDARHVHKNRTSYQDGYKAHLAVDPDTGIITAVALRPGSGPEHHEAVVAADLLAGEDGPRRVLGDSPYGTGQLRAELAGRGHTLVVKCPPVRPAVPGGFVPEDFVVDTQAAAVTCPAGHTVGLGRPDGQGRRQARFTVRCAGCPLRSRCTTSVSGRNVSVHPHHDVLAAARRRQATDPAWRAEYRRWRPPVERAIAGVVARGNRRLRYIGRIRNDAWLHRRAAAVNLRTLVARGLWHDGVAWRLSSVT